MRKRLSLAVAESSSTPSRQPRADAPRRRVLLVKPPFFSPWTPPLGIALLKAHLEKHGHAVTCADFNVDSMLWGTHHQYFEALAPLNQTPNDGYSKLWYVLNAHLLAHLNGASRATCEMVLERILPLYGMASPGTIANRLQSIVERYFARLDEMTLALDGAAYDAVGTSTYTTSLASSLYVLRRVKELNPGIKTVMGGGIFADDLALGSENLDTLLREYPFVDHCILGEGEGLLHLLLDGVLDDKRVISIQDIGGKTLDMVDSPLPDFSDLELDRYFHLTIEGARSCPFQCNFCSETVQWGEYRRKPKDTLPEQVRELAARHGVRMFFMGDSLMNPYVSSFSKALIESNASILYDGYLRADKPVRDRRNTKTWAKSGLFRCRLGIESASARVLESMNKETTPEGISEVLKSLSTAGIRPTTYWIVGFPGETDADFEETLDFVRRHSRFIYELEAHPYYYYPYGQIHSRLFQCKSLYSDEVTDVLRFKEWDILDVRPTRTERYERLRRMSELAIELGIPNIYTMADRYAAERRWQLLHPSVRVVYDGTAIDRPRRRAPDRAYVPAHAASGVAAYAVAVNGSVDRVLAGEAVRALVEHNEILQVRACGDEYRPVDALRPALQPVFHEGVLDASVLHAAARHLDATTGDSFRVLIAAHGATTTIAIVLHNLVGDARSAALLVEDLYRIVVQLSAGEPVRLAPRARSLAETERPRSSRPQRAAQIARRTWHRSVVAIPAPLARRVMSRCVDLGLTPREVIEAAFIPLLIERSLLLCTFDERRSDVSLSHEPGCFTRLVAVPEDLGRLLREARTAPALNLAFSDVRRGLARSTPAEPAGSGVLLNTDYLGEPAWVGGDDWTPLGFVDMGTPEVDVAMSVTPVLRESDGAVTLDWTREAASLAELVASEALAAIERVVEINDGTIEHRELAALQDATFSF